MPIVIQMFLAILISIATSGYWIRITVILGIAMVVKLMQLVDYFDIDKGFLYWVAGIRGLLLIALCVQVYRVFNEVTELLVPISGWGAAVQELKRLYRQKKLEIKMSELTEGEKHSAYIELHRWFREELKKLLTH